MVKINCLFNFDGLYYRLEVDSKNNENCVTYEDLLVSLRENLKLKCVDFFDSDKYIIEIFDKEFDEFIKLPRGSIIPDFTKMRARLKPKAIYTVPKNDSESLKRPFYSEINLEEEPVREILSVSLYPPSPSPPPPPTSLRSHDSFPLHKKPRLYYSSYNTRDSVESNPPANTNVSESSNQKRNADNLSESNSSKLTLVKAVCKYNDEFLNIMMFDNIWETENVWRFVFREISGQGVKDIKSIAETREQFKTLVDKYVSILQKSFSPENEIIKSWPLFEIFHQRINLKPFYGRIQTLKDAFASKSRLQEDSTINILADQANEMHSISSPQQTNVPSPSVSTFTSLNITSDDFRLLLAVEDFNKKFYDSSNPEYIIWREVTDQVNLYQPFESSLVMKYKTRFYDLLREFIKIRNSSIPVAEKAQWKLYSSFTNIDTTPFLSKL